VLWETVMYFADDLEVDRKEHSLIIRSERRIAKRVTGVLLSLVCVFFFLISIKDAADHIELYVFMVWMVICICIGLHVAVPRVVTTVVDLHLRQVLHDLDSVWGWYKRHRSYAFAGVAGVGTKKYSGRGGVSYMPVIVMTDRRAIELADHGGPEGRYANVIDIICAATGWPTVDV